MPLVTVNDPFEEPLIVELFPNYDASPIKLLMVDVTFEDPGISLRREQRLEFSGPEPSSQRLRFARATASAKRFAFQVTVLGHDNSVRKLSPTETQDTVVFLGALVTSESGRTAEAALKEEERSTYSTRNVPSHLISTQGEQR